MFFIEYSETASAVTIIVVPIKPDIIQLYVDQFWHKKKKKYSAAIRKILTRLKNEQK